MRRTVSLVEQDDALFGVLTVRETVSYAARLSLPRNTPNIGAHIDATLRSLGLQDVANNKIGTPLQRGISGGQKRRVTIACSVISRPRVLVLDEPTSGLDSGSALEVMSSLKRLALETNMVCIATIHQPNWEVFSLFDRLTLLAGGRVMYNGPASRSIFSVSMLPLSHEPHLQVKLIDTSPTSAILALNILTLSTRL
jgi:ABC-type multidrug transport system ATPase subunit